MGLMLIVALLASAQTTPPPSTDGSICTAASLNGCPLSDGINTFSFNATIVDTRGYQILRNGAVLSGDAGSQLLWCSGAMYNKTNSGTYWKYNGTNFAINSGTVKPVCSTPPPAISSVTANCPATATVGVAFSCTATVQPATADQSVIWTPAMPYTPSAAGAMIAKATSTVDTSKSGTASVAVTATTIPDCPTTGTVTATVPINITVGGVTIPPVNQQIACTWNMDYSTGTMTISGCQAGATPAKAPMKPRKKIQQLH